MHIDAAWAAVLIAAVGLLLAALKQGAEATAEASAKASENGVKLGQIMEKLECLSGLVDDVQTAKEDLIRHDGRIALIEAGQPPRVLPRIWDRR